MILERKKKSWEETGKLLERCPSVDMTRWHCAEVDRLLQEKRGLSCTVDTVIRKKLFKRKDELGGGRRMEEKQKGKIQ